jgi:hypothetical protein
MSLVASSLFFQIPAIYAYRHGAYCWGTASFITSVLSMNYWRHPVHSWRRTVDIYWARSVGCYFFVYGCQVSVGLSVNGLVWMLGCYYKSYRYSKRWRLYHMAFHALAALNQFLVIHYHLQKNGLSSSVLS